MPASYTYNPDKPKTAANYPLIGNPGTQFYTTRNMRILGAVNHIAVTADDFSPPDTSAEAVNRYGATTTRQASWTWVCDSDSILDSLPDSYTAWAQGVRGHSFNSPFLSAETGKRTTLWEVDTNARDLAILENLAYGWAFRVIKYVIPIRYVLDRNQIDYLIARDAMVGFTDHYILDPANRSDPGLYNGRNTFPRDHFLELTTKYVTDIRGGTIYQPPSIPDLPAVDAPLVIDGRLGPATIRRWQKAMGTVQDGYITATGSSLVRAVQIHLNNKGVGDKYNRRLVVDGKGILPNLSRSYGPTNTVAALQRYLGTYVDGVLSNPSSKAVAALQNRLNNGSF